MKKKKNPIDDGQHNKTEKQSLAAHRFTHYMLMAS
jgi:hypothetical protein